MIVCISKLMNSRLNISVEHKSPGRQLVAEIHWRPGKFHQNNFQIFPLQLDRPSRGTTGGWLVRAVG